MTMNSSWPYQDSSLSTSPLDNPHLQPPRSIISTTDIDDEVDSDTLDDNSTALTESNSDSSNPSSSPIISHLGPISPVEELTPAINLQSTSTSSPRRAAFLHPALASHSTSATSSSSTSTSTTTSSSNTGTCKLVLDWSRTRTAGAIFQSSSGISKVQVAVRPPSSRAKASIERFKWSASEAILYNTAREGGSSIKLKATSTTAIPSSPSRNTSK